MSETDCIFCKIVKGKIPSHKIYEDENFLAFLDINPQSPGHTQVIPKKHFRWVWNLPGGQVPGNIGDYFKVVQKIALAQQKAFNTDFILSKIIGDEVEHAHIWVYPGELPSQSFGESSKTDLEGNAEKIRKAI
ncbi:MAG: HIT domain-containing protein [Candidatus Zambryskibacteria bacterium]|nr:HIT domain-containing protein [Candidatus Zambryskibacteria bacterium]